MQIPVGVGDPDTVELPPPEDGNVRKANITKENIRKAGYFEGCHGCRAMGLDVRPQGHSQECRKRIDEVWTMEKDDRVTRQDARINEKLTT